MDSGPIVGLSTLILFWLRCASAAWGEQRGWKDWIHQAEGIRLGE